MTGQRPGSRKTGGRPDSPASRQSVSAVFEAQARKTPDAPAVSLGAEVLTYGALDAAANRIADRLREMGARPGSFVAVCAARTPATIAGLLGAWKAGAVYVPIDANAPARRIAWLLRDAGAAIALTDAGHAERLPPERPVVLLDGAAEAARLTARPARAVAGPDAVACLMYTSGTTGEPKGVEVSHRGILRMLVGADYARF
jgi:non-ribosomal peptide synthetase component F